MFIIYSGIVWSIRVFVMTFKAIILMISSYINSDPELLSFGPVQRGAADSTACTRKTCCTRVPVAPSDTRSRAFGTRLLVAVYER